jgi:hypothetical protein
MMRLFLHNAALVLCALSGTTIFLSWLSYCSPLRADTWGQCANCVAAGSIGKVPCNGLGDCHLFTGVQQPCSWCRCGSTVNWPGRPKCVG